MTSEPEQPQPQHIQSLYDILGCEKTATFEEIKKSYRIKARQLHPDRNREDPNATEKFQQLSQAYEILKDPVKREQYDRFGLSGETPQTLDEMQMFEMMTQVIGLSRSRAPPAGPKVSPTFRICKVPMKVAYTGGTVKKKFKLFITCPLCKGSGSTDGVEYPICEDCHGSGSLFPTGGLTLLFPCRNCNKVGYHTPIDKICPRCDGHKIIQVKKEVEVPIEIGIPDQEQIVIPNKGDEYPGKEPADLNLVIVIQNQNGLIREGDDLFFIHDVSNIELAKGTSFKIKTLDGRELHYCTKKGEKIQCNRLCCIPNEGFPCRNNVQLKGNLYIRFSPPLFGIPGAVIFPFLELGRAAASAIRSMNDCTVLEYMDLEQQQLLFDRERAEEEADDGFHGYVPPPRQE
ncbi:DnaJ domain containing protein [Tritrichomonas foetus]|uniref:DnaJ domain containing protein n=1 Tax=Tritrichomonas foetus TaxID=1144522 RepID=A0A1J4KGK6_9EUKA|nr:DnaJ domain containing protein [Tritrichomonas foetus]|eukprot:OHT08461.1 DnaJ domain containing protein [Tritrichomonas foetus]